MSVSNSSSSSKRQFVSVRDCHSPPQYYSFECALLNGYASDGGMFLPSQFPQLSFHQLLNLYTISITYGYPRLVVEILSLFIDSSEITYEHLKILIENSFQKFQKLTKKHGKETVQNDPIDIKSFQQTLSEQDNAPNEQLKTAMGEDVIKANQLSAEEILATKTVHMLETWHGPTAAFKDLAMQVCAQLLHYFLQRNSSTSSSTSSDSSSSTSSAVCSSVASHLSLLIGTSGDTGSAAIEAFRDLSSVDVYVLYPGGNRISSIQEAQMTSVHSDNIFVVEVNGTSDDLDIPIKKCFDDKIFREKYQLGSVNSPNICRILVQIVHYFWAYFQIIHENSIQKNQKIEENDFKSNFVAFYVPSGALGNLVSAVIAKRMGLPIERIVAAGNENSLLERFVQSGQFIPSSSIQPSAAPAIDIGNPYNIERLLYLLALTEGKSAVQSAEFTIKHLNSLEKDKQFTLSSESLSVLKKDIGLQATTTKNEQISKRIRQLFSSFSYLIDPHTAVAYDSFLSSQLSHSSASTSASSNGVQCTPVVICTAHPVKFPSLILSALPSVTAVQLSSYFSHSPFLCVRNISVVAKLQRKKMTFEGKLEEWETKLKWLVKNVWENRIKKIKDDKHKHAEEEEENRQQRNIQNMASKSNMNLHGHAL